MVTIVAVALGLALGIQAFLVKPFRIPSESMVPTLDIGQRVLVDRVNYRFGRPDRGDVVVFKPPRGADSHGGEECGVRRPQDSPCPRGTRQRSDTNFIKRIVAVGGDRLKVVDNHVYIDGKRQKESFIKRGTECAAPLCNLPHEIRIPKGYYFMMGDNRGESDDSRAWGPVPKKWLIGKAFATYWPPRRIGVL
ncbi:MAG: signal peptidase I [Thermoleophilaceae bacterium]